MFHSSKVSFLPPMPCAVVCFTPVIWEDIPPADGGREAPLSPWSPATEPHIYVQISHWDSSWVPHTRRLLPSHFPICPACPASKASTSSIHLTFLKINRGLELNDNIGPVFLFPILISVVLSTKLMVPDYTCCDCWHLRQVRGRFPHCFPTLWISTALKAVAINSVVSWASSRILGRKATIYN